MEIPIIKHPNRDFIPNSHSPSFLLRNGFTDPQFEASDIEMITIPAVKYTSLRDIMPEHPPPPAIMSPAKSSSWNEIPIKNPLVKQAALAYLQPMSTPPEVGNKGLFGMLKEKCFCGGRGELGCFQWLSGVVFKTIAEIFVRFCEGRGIDESEEDDEEEDDEENVD